MSVRKRDLLARGWRKRCPRCGEGRLFARWTVLHERCPECDLVLEPSPGATWAFWVLGDRVFVVLALLPIYFGLRLPSWPLRAFVMTVLLVAFFVSMPNRQGVAIALDYLTRIRWGDPTEPRSPEASD